MSKAWTLVVALFLSLQEDPIAAQAMKGYKDPWADFGDTSSVTLRETIRRPDISDAGKLIYRDVTNEITWTIAASSGEKTMMKVEGGGQESVFPFFINPPNWARGKGEKKGVEELSVGERKIKCDIMTITLDADKDAGQVTTISKSAELAYWAARLRVETLIKGKVNTSEEEVLLDIDQKVKVGDRDYFCSLVQVTVEAVGGLKTVRKEWRSDEVPGRVMRREGRQFQNGKELESGVSQMEVVRFKAKR